MKSQHFLILRIIKGLLVGVLFLIDTLNINAQHFNCNNCTIFIRAKGNGTTTGNVINLTIINPNNVEVDGRVGPCYINSFNDYQSYLIPTQLHLTIKAFDSIKINLTGYCTDIRKQPLPIGNRTTPVEKWTILDPLEAILVPPDLIKLNLEEYDEIKGRILLGGLEVISKTYDSLKLKNKIITPFSGNPEKEREVVIQQTFWKYTSEINKKPYTEKEFLDRSYRQYEENANIKIKYLSLVEIQKLDSGLKNLWNIFSEIAKISGITGSAADKNEIKELAAQSKPRVKDTFITKPSVMPAMPKCQCNKCLFSDKFIITDSATKQIYSSSTVPPNTTILIQQPPLIANDCPNKCPLRTFNEFDIKWIECGITKYDHSVYSQIKKKTGRSGILYLEYRAVCYCDEKVCCKQVIRQELKIAENSCCEKIRCKKDNLNQLLFIDPKDPKNQVIIQANKLKFSIKQQTNFIQHEESFDFNLEDIFCTLNEDQIRSQVWVTSEENYKSNPSFKTSQKSIVLTGISKWKTYIDKSGNNLKDYRSPWYTLQFDKSMNINGINKDVKITMSVNETTCQTMIQIVIDDEVHEFTTN